MGYFAAKDETKIYFNDQGTGQPVVLIHGWPLNADMFEYQTIALLDKGYRVIGYDRRGFGKSGKPGKGYDYNTFASDLDGLINHLDLREVNLVGFSMGGGEIARYLTQYGPSKVKRAVLISSIVPYLLKTDSNPDGVPEKMFDDMIGGLKEDRPKFLTGFTKTFFGAGVITSPVSDEMMMWANSLALQAELKATAECVTAFGKTDFRTDLKSFTMPTLIIHGTADKIVPIAPSGEAAAKGIPGAIFKKYDGAPHGLFITHRNQLIEDLFSFLGK